MCCVRYLTMSRLDAVAVATYIMAGYLIAVHAQSCSNVTICEHLSGATDGEFVFAVLMDVHGTSSRGCGTVSVSAVQQIEAIIMMFDEFNRRNHIPGVKLGLRVFDTCGRSELAVSQLQRILPSLVSDTEHCTQDDSLIFLGVIGPNRREPINTVSRMLKQRHPASPYPQIFYGAGSKRQVASTDRYGPQSLCLIPPESYLIQVVSQLLEILDWNYVAVLYTDDTYGLDLFRLLKATPRLCVASSQALSLTSAVYKSDIERFLNTIEAESKNPVTGVVYLGYEDGAIRLLEVANEVRSAHNLEFIVTNIINAPLKTLAKYHNVAPGLFTISDEVYAANFFTAYWKDLVNDVGRIRSKSDSNPWLPEVVMRFGKCIKSKTTVAPGRNSIKNCDSVRVDDNFAQQVSSYVGYAINAAHVFAAAAKQLHQRYCYHTKGICRALKAMGSTARLSLKSDHTFFNFTDTLEQFNVSASLFQNVIFDDNGNIHWRRAIYPIYNLQVDQRNAVYFLKIGEYADGKVHLNQSRTIKMYTWSKDVLSGSLLPKSLCITTCKSCFDLTSFADQTMIVAGDYYIVMFAMVTDAGSRPYQCADHTRSLGLDTAEAARFLVTSINSNISRHHADIFPTSKLGFIVINICSDTLVTAKRLMTLNTGSLSDPSGRLRSLRDKIIGYTTVTSSSTAQVIAKTAQKYNLVTVAGGATAPNLSDRNEYPYFLRLTTPDDKQIIAILSLLKHFQWHYVQVIYQNDVYGKGGLRLMQQQAKSYNVCIAAYHEMSASELPHGAVLAHALRKWFTARVVVVFAQRSVMTNITNRLQNNVNVKNQEFVFVGSEAWGNSQEVTDGTSVAFGSFTIGLKYKTDKEFLSYMANLDPRKCQDNPWLVDYWQNFFQCNMPRSFRKPYSKICSEDLRLTMEKGYKQDNYSPFALRAVYALAAGATSAIRRLCKNFDGKLCSEYFSKIHTVYEAIRNVKYPIGDNDTEEQLFDHNGDGMSGYDLYYIQEGDDGYRKNNYIKVAEWKAHSGLVFEDDYEAIIGDSKEATECTRQSECSHCASESSSVTPVKTTDPGDAVLWRKIAIVFIVLFVVVLIAFIAYVIVNKYLNARRLEKLNYLDVYEKPIGMVYPPHLSNRRLAETPTLSLKETETVGGATHDSNSECNLSYSPNYVGLVHESEMSDRGRNISATNRAFTSDNDTLKKADCIFTLPANHAIIPGRTDRTDDVTAAVGAPSPCQSQNGSGCSTYRVNNASTAPLSISKRRSGSPHASGTTDSNHSHSGSNIPSRYQDNGDLQRSDRDILRLGVRSPRCDDLSSSGVSSAEIQSPNKNNADYLTVCSPQPPHSPDETTSSPGYLSPQSSSVGDSVKYNGAVVVSEQVVFF